MSLQIRMAEAQGILTGSSLSPVQTEALKIRLMEKSVKEQEARIDSIRFALIAHDPQNISELFPELFPASNKVTTEKEVDEVFNSSEPVVFESVASEDVESILAMLGQSGILSEDDLDGIT